MCGVGVPIMTSAYVVQVVKLNMSFLQHFLLHDMAIGHISVKPD